MRVVTANTTITIGELLEAFKPAWKYSNERFGDTLIRPDYHLALRQVWEDIIIKAAKEPDVKPVSFLLDNELRF